MSREPLCTVPAAASRQRAVLTTLAVMGLQAVFVAGVVIVCLGGRDRAWRVPFHFYGDTLVYLAQSKSTVDNGWWWVNSREGVPVGLQALLFPSNTNVDQAIVWAVSKVFGDPLLSTNLAWLVMLVVAAWTATYGFRKLGCSLLSALVGGALFALSPYALYRHLGHFSLVTYLVPFPATVAVLLMSARLTGLETWRKASPLLVGCALVGFNYVYYAFFGCFFIALATVAGYWRSRNPTVVRLGCGSLGTLIVCVALNFLPSVVVGAREGKAIVIRDKVPAEAEVYALKIRQLVSPVFEHTFPPFRTWTRTEAQASFPLETENMVSRLGLVASFGFLGLLGTLFLSRAVSPFGSTIVSASHLTVAGILLATMGGFGSLFNLLVVPDIRAYNRICPFLAFFALLAIAEFIDSTSRRRRSWGITAALTVLTLGVWDQAQVLKPLESARATIFAEYAALRSFVRQLERSEPPQTMVLQLPFTVYLNEGSLNRMGPYDHFKPYLVSRSLKWSYPALSNAQFTWQEAAAQLEPSQLAPLAVGEGFRVILIDRYGYPDNAAAVIAGLLAVPGTRMIPIENERYAAIELGAVVPLETANGQPVRDFLLDRPATPALHPCSGAAVVSLDRIGSNIAPLSPGQVQVSRSRDLVISGWAVIPISNQAGADVEMTVGGEVYPAYYGFDRPDVAAYLKNAEAAPSGFRAVIPANRLKAGTEPLAVRVVPRNQSCFFESPAVSLVVR